MSTEEIAWNYRSRLQDLVSLTEDELNEAIETNKKTLENHTSEFPICLDDYELAWDYKSMYKY